MERLGKLSESGRSFDVEFWQRQESSAIFAAAWEMLVEANQWKKKSDSDLAFQRTVESLESLRKPARKNAERVFRSECCVEKNYLATVESIPESAHSLTSKSN